MSHVIEVIERYSVPDIPQIELPSEDGIPLESNWHRIQINLLVDCVRQHWRDRTNFFAGGNMFVYYSLQQARNRDYKGPDFFVVKNVDGTRPRDKWVVWAEDGRRPHVIVELLSPSTANLDLGKKKDLYEQQLETPEYFCYDPDTYQLQGWELEPWGYITLKPNPHGRLQSDQLRAWLGLWQGTYEGVTATWVRLYTADGLLVPTAEEYELQRAEVERRRADAAQQRAEAEKQRADVAEMELAHLRAELQQLKSQK